MSSFVRATANYLRKRLDISLFRNRGRYVQDGLTTLHSDHFRRDQAFIAAYGRGVQASKGVDPGFEWRVHIALWAAHASLEVQGDFVECGVNAGFISSAIMHDLKWDTVPRSFYLIDTFSGPVFSQYSEAERKSERSTIARRALEAGAYVTDLNRVRANFAEWNNAIVVQGVVPDVLNTIAFRRVAFLHIDMNCAFPECAALQFFWDKLPPGGVVLLDDYGYLGHGEQRTAIDNLARKLAAKVLCLPTGQGLIIRQHSS